MSSSTAGNDTHLGAGNHGEEQEPVTPTPTGQQYQYPPVPVPVTPGDNKAAVTQQPTPAKASRIPLDLEVLVELDKFFVIRRIDNLEACMGTTSKNTYKVKDPQGEAMFVATEDTGLCARQLFSSCRALELTFLDKRDKEVILIKRPFACDCCSVPCFLQSLEVFSPPSKLIGTVQQEWGLFVPAFTVKDLNGKVMLRIEGPFCTSAICGYPEFQVLSHDGSTQVGKISKKWPGISRDAFTDADNFGISFPKDLDVKMKAVLIGAGFLINLLYFEE